MPNEDKKFTSWFLGIGSTLFIALLVWVGSAIYSLTDSTIRLQETAKHSEKQIGENSRLIQRASIVLAKVEASTSMIELRVEDQENDINMLSTAYHKGRRFTWTDGKELRKMCMEVIRKIELRLTRLETKMDERGEL